MSNNDYISIAQKIRRAFETKEPFNCGVLIKLVTNLLAKPHFIVSKKSHEKIKLVTFKLFFKYHIQ